MMRPLRRYLIGTTFGLVCVVLSAGSVRAQQNPSTSPRVFVRDAGPGRAGRWLRDALAAPHVLIRSDSLHPAELRRDSSFSTTVIVLGPARVASTVHGDVIVVGGDLFLHPGVRIDGKAVAIGGGVYWTSLGTVGGGRFSFPEFTYVSTVLPDGSIALDYLPLEKRDTRVVVLPGVYGLRIPSYDRTNGLSIPYGPTVRFDTARIEIDPQVVYRSQLGTVDPRLEFRAAFGRRLTVEGVAGRNTETNEDWIYSDISNSITTLYAGNDIRNYYRASRAEVRAAYRWEGERAQLSLVGGGLGEKASSARPDTGARGGPWALRGRHDIDDMLRPNPRVRPGTIASALGGVRVDFSDQGVVAHLTSETELPFTTPGDARFVQTTLDGSVTFPTFKTQRMEFESHAVLTAGDTAPPQRFAWVGGPGTLPTFEILEFGGDEMFFTEARYIIPVDRIRVKYLGSPTFTLRYMTGGAAIARFPTLEQNVGARLAISFLRVDYVVDPSSRDSKFTVGLSFFR
jgi:hypothetical protein